MLYMFMQSRLCWLWQASHTQEWSHPLFHWQMLLYPQDSPHSPSAMANQQYCLKWNNHQSNLLRAFDRLLQSESFTDVTLACEGKSLRAHKVSESLMWWCKSREIMFTGSSETFVNMELLRVCRKKTRLCIFLNYFFYAFRELAKGNKKRYKKRLGQIKAAGVLILLF